MANIPTPQELEAENARLLAELEKPEAPETQGEEKEPQAPQETPKEQVLTPTEEEKEPEIEPESAPSPDYKEKFSQSSKEAQKVVAKNRKINQAIDQANELEQPTDEEMQAKYPQWEEMDDATKQIAIDSTIANKKFSLIAKAREEGKKIEKWDEDVTKYVENPQTLIDHPGLEGKIDAFKLYATKESNNSVPLEVLTKAFLFEEGSTTKKKGGMFPTGSGGPNEKPKKDDKISVAESENLRKTNYKRYQELLMAGKISTEL